MSGLIDRIFPRRNDSPDQPDTGDTPPGAESTAPADEAPLTDAPFETPDAAGEQDAAREPVMFGDAPLESDDADADDPVAEEEQATGDVVDDEEPAGEEPADDAEPLAAEGRGDDVVAEEDASAEDEAPEDEAPEDVVAAGDTPPSGFEPVEAQADEVEAGDTPPSGFEPVEAPAPDDTGVIPVSELPEPDETGVLPAVEEPAPDETAVMPAAGVDETQVLPAVGAEAPAEAEGKKRRFGRRKKRIDPLAPPSPVELPAAEQPAAPPQQQPAAPVLVASPAAVDMPDSPGISVRAKLRRRLRFLRKERELLLRDLGGFVFDSRRFARSREDLVTLKIQKLGEVDFELRKLEEALNDRRSLHELREPGIGGACSNCGAFFPSSARYCTDCGASVSQRKDFGADAPTAATPAVAPPAAAAQQPTQPPAQPQPAAAAPPPQPIQPSSGSLWSGSPAPAGANGAPQPKQPVTLPGGITRPEDETGAPPPMSSGDPLQPPPKR